MTFQVFNYYRLFSNYTKNVSIEQCFAIYGSENRLIPVTITIFKAYFLSIIGVMKAS